MEDLHSTTLFAFRVDAPSATRSVELRGSWDGFTHSYHMTRDHRKGPRQWAGVFTFKDIVCDGYGPLLSEKRQGGLKMGGTYWYHYVLDGVYEYHDEFLPFTTACPLLPGECVNILEVPYHERLDDDDLDYASVFTLDPNARFTTGRPNKFEAFARKPVLPPQSPSLPFPDSRAREAPRRRPSTPVLDRQDMGSSGLVQGCNGGKSRNGPAPDGATSARWPEQSCFAKEKVRHAHEGDAYPGMDAWLERTTAALLGGDRLPWPGAHEFFVELGKTRAGFAHLLQGGLMLGRAGPWFHDAPPPGVAKVGGLPCVEEEASVAESQAGNDEPELIHDPSSLDESPMASPASCSSPCTATRLLHADETLYGEFPDYTRQDHQYLSQATLTKPSHQAAVFQSGSPVQECMHDFLADFGYLREIVI